MRCRFPSGTPTTSPLVPWLFIFHLFLIWVIRLWSVCVCVYAQGCPTFNPMDCSPPGSSAHGILQARILEWVDISSSRGSFQPRDRTHISCGLLHWQMDTLPLAPLGRVFSLSYFPRNLYFGFFPSARHPEREILSGLACLHLWHHLTYGKCTLLPPYPWNVLHSCCSLLSFLPLSGIPGASVLWYIVTNSYRTMSYSQNSFVIEVDVVLVGLVSFLGSTSVPSESNMAESSHAASFNLPKGFNYCPPLVLPTPALGLVPGKIASLPLLGRENAASLAGHSYEWPSCIRMKIHI